METKKHLHNRLLKIIYLLALAFFIFFCSLFVFINKNILHSNFEVTYIIVLFILITIITLTFLTLFITKKTIKSFLAPITESKSKIVQLIIAITGVGIAAILIASIFILLNNSSFLLILFLSSSVVALCLIILAFMKTEKAKDSE